MNKNMNRVLLLTASFFVILAGIIVFRSLQSGSSATANVPALGSAQTTKRFTSADRASQGNPSSRNAHASTKDDRVIRLPRKVSERFIESELPPTADQGKRFSEKLTWSMENLTLLGLDKHQQAGVQEALDQASARAFEVIKKKVKKQTFSEAMKSKTRFLSFDEADTKKKGIEFFEIPDWSKEEGVALRNELTKALEREVSAADAAFLMKQLSRREKFLSAASQTLFGEGKRNLYLYEKAGEWTFIEMESDVSYPETVSEVSKEWMDVFNLPAK
jgi:hypothetical protein